MFPFFFFVFAAFTGTKGEGLLADGPLLKVTGESVIFSTSKIETEKPFSSVRWTFETTEILTAVASSNNTSPEYEGRINYFPSTGSLELRNLQSNDSGVYAVVIVSGEAVSYPGSILLNVYDAVSGVTVSPTSGELEEEDTLILRCTSSGSSLSFLWRNGSMEVTTSDRVELSDGNKTLTINSVTRYDNGLYSCQVSNPVSNSTSGTVNITVSYGPDGTQITMTPNQQHHNVGSTIKLKCFADSSPSPRYTWFMNNTELSSTGEELNLINVDLSLTGNYYCLASNPLTGAHLRSSSVSIIVIENISGGSLQPTLQLPVEGRPFNLTCEASGSIFIRKWMNGSSDLIMNDNVALYDNDRVLAFNPVTRQDTGEYTCIISNPINSITANYNLVVNYGPENVEITGESKIKQGDPIKLTCVANSIPDALYSWLLNENLILNNSKEFLKNSAALSDSGNYTCKTWNQITEKTSLAVVGLSVIAGPLPHSPPYWIIGVVFACLVVAGLGGGGYYYYQKKKKMGKNVVKMSTNRKTSEEPVNKNIPTVPLPGEGSQNNATYSGEELNYVEANFFKNQNRGKVQLNSQDSTSIYSDIKVNNNHNASTPSPPTYDVHMQQNNKPTAPTRVGAAALYSRVNKKQAPKL